jgi:branched-chain amino acid transport system permease protein
MPDSSLVFFQIINGLIWGLIVAQLAVGLNLVYGLLNIVNVAQGALFMVGGYICWLIVAETGSYYASLLVAPVAVGAIAVVIERVLLRPLAQDSSLTIIATIGLMLVLEQAALWAFGGDVRSVAAPLQFSVPVFGLSYPGFRIFIALCSIAVLVALWLFLQYTRYGLWMRAVKFNPSVASAFGVPVNRVIGFTFGLGTALAALGGVLAAPIVNVRPEMGLDILITVFIVVIVGGLGSLPGSVIAAIVMTMTEGIAAVFTAPTNARLISLIVLTLIVLKWPNGIGAARSKSVRI